MPLMAVAGGAVAVLVVYPMATLLVQAFEAGGAAWQRALSGTSLAAIANTLWSSAAATALAVVSGGLFAFATERALPAGRAWLRLGICLPLLVPPFIGAFGWLQAYGRAGVLEKLTGISWPGLIGAGGVVALLAIQNLPLVYLPVAAALAAQNPIELERAARASGADFWTAAWTISLPLMRPALAVGAGLSFIAAASDFGIPAVVGLPGRFSTVTTEIYRDLSFSSNATSFATAAALATLLALLAGLLLAFLRTSPQGAVAAAAGAYMPPSRGRSTGLVIAIVGWLWVSAASLFPLAAMALVALTRAYGLPLALENFSLVHFSQALTGAGGQALLRSCLLSGIAASVVAALGMLVALWSRADRLGRTVEATLALPFAIPGSALAVAIILAFSRWLYGTLAIIVLAYVARFCVLGSRPVAAALASVGPDPLRAARVFGAAPLRGLVTGALPAVLPAAVAGWLLVFLTALHELTVSSLLYTPATQTIAVVVLNAEQLGDVATTAALGVLLTAVVVLAAVPLTAWRSVRRTVGGLGG